MPAAFWGRFPRSVMWRQKAWDDVLAVNVTANWAADRAMDPLLRLSSAGRVVFVTRASWRIPRAYLGAYAVSSGRSRRSAHLRGRDGLDVGSNLFNPGATAPACAATACRARTRPS